MQLVEWNLKREWGFWVGITIKREYSQFFQSERTDVAVCIIPTLVLRMRFELTDEHRVCEL